MPTMTPTEATVTAPAPAASPPPAPRPQMPIILNGSVRLPWFRDQEEFRRWAREERPERGRFAYLGDAIWVDWTMEQADTHNDIKAEVAGVLRAFARTAPKGRYYTDGMLNTHVGAG